MTTAKLLAIIASVAVLGGLSVLPLVIGPPGWEPALCFVCAILSPTVVYCVQRWLHSVRRPKILVRVVLLAGLAGIGYSASLKRCVIRSQEDLTLRDVAFFPFWKTKLEQSEKKNRQTIVDEYGAFEIQRQLDAEPGASSGALNSAIAMLLQYAVAYSGFLTPVSVGVLLLGETRSRRAPASPLRYKIALSFAGGPYRDFMDKVAEHLQREFGKDGIFYDSSKSESLGRPDLDQYLASVFASQSELVVVFVSAEYKERDYCRVEWEVIHEQLILGRRSEQVMLLGLDKTRLEGMHDYDFSTPIAADDARKAAQLIAKRWTELTGKSVDEPHPDSEG